MKRIAGFPTLSPLVVAPPQSRILTVDGYDGLGLWTNAKAVSGGYRKAFGFTRNNSEVAMVLQLPAAERVEFAPYMVLFMVKTVGGAIAMSYGPIIDTGGVWERHRFVLRWPMGDEQLASVFNLYWYGAATFIVDDIQVNRIDKATECAAYVDAVMDLTGAHVPYPGAPDMSLLPRTAAKLAANGSRSITVLILGDSWSASTSCSKWDALIERALPGIAVRCIGWAIGGSTAAIWNTVDMSSVFAVEHLIDLVVFGCISDPFTTASDWNALIGKIKVGMPTTDLLICDRLGRGNSGDSAMFMEPICEANGVAFYDAEGSYDSWVYAGGTPVKPDGVHLEVYSAEALGEGLAWRLGATPQ
jgi:hypothetical protein